MVPAGDFYSNQSLKDETFVLTNICPQNAVLNRGIWASLENSIREKIIKLNTEAYIITGSIFSSDSIHTIGIDKVGVPDYFYKIMLYTRENLRCMHLCLIIQFIDSWVLLKIFRLP